MTQQHTNMDRAKHILSLRKELDSLNVFMHAYVLSKTAWAWDVVSEETYPPGARARLIDGTEVTVVRNDGVFGAEVNDGISSRSIAPRFLFPLEILR